MFAAKSAKVMSTSDEADAAGSHRSRDWARGVRATTTAIGSIPAAFSRDFSGIAVSPSARASQSGSLAARGTQRGMLQSKLAIGPVDDRLEREADAVADRVMRMQDPALSMLAVQERVSRKCAACEREEAEEEKLQAKSIATTEHVAAAPYIVHEVIRSPGRPLDAATRAFFEPRFGYDFSQVRVHSDPKAAQSARAVNALAYTVGRDVVFGTGQYAPGTGGGRMLMAHELTHVVQQGASARSRIWIGSEHGQSERSAVRKAATVAPELTASAGISSTRSGRVALQRLAGPEIPLTAAQIAEFRMVAQQVAALIRSGALAAEESSAISAAVVEADAAIVATEGVVTTIVAATTAAEGATVASAALAADDVTVIGAADDVAIPFTLIAAAVGFGVGFGVGYLYRDEIAAAAEKVQAAVNVMRRIIAAHTTAPNQSTAPQTNTKQQSQTDESRKRRQKCFEINPGAIACEEPIYDGDDIRDEIVAEWLMNNGYEFSDLGNCTQFGPPIGPGRIEDCNGAPAIRYHCGVRGTKNVVTIFACLCCDREGNSRWQWSKPHWSDNASRRGN